MASLSLRLASSSSRSARLVSALTHAPRARYVHYRNELPYPVEGGLGDFLPPDGLRMLAVDYQQGVLDRLNDQVKDTELASKSVVQTVIDAARDPNKVLEFNYASEALNNSFFLENLRPPPPDATTHEGVLNVSGGSSLNNAIRTNYGSLAHLKSNFGAAVNGMFSGGWIWFVTDQQGNLGICPTFGTGTLLVRSGKAQFIAEWQMQQEAMSSSRAQDPSAAPFTPTATSPASGLAHGAPPLHPHTPSRSLMSSSGSRPFTPVPNSNIYQSTGRPELTDSEKDKTRIGETLYPLFCVSVHERAWMGAGYGVWGKEEYIKRFWSVLDWKKVAATYNVWSRDVRHQV